MNKDDIERIMEMINELVASTDEKLFDDLPTCQRVNAIEYALRDVADIPRPDQPTPDWYRLRSLEETR